nr:putative retrotransposon protein [Tanacetum cinerariifolium]
MDQLHALGKSYDNDMAIKLINRSLNKDFGDFVRNFNMHCMGKTVTELHALLIDYEKGLKDKAPTPQVLTIQKDRENKPKLQANKKDKRKGKTNKNKKVMPYQPKHKHNPLKRKENPNKDQTCHHGHVAGHWKRNCPLYLEELQKIRTRLSTVGFKEERKLSYGEQYLQVGNDVCGPLRHVSRKCASYFLTFTDDFSRYGYVYLLKHKHEVFEEFKVFKSEVELQLGKKIKALHSDRGSDYLSQEFKDYLSKNGIVQHLTSPYTSQQNGVSEKRNRTLLDMVRSMFNLMNLPLSFWDYALESAVRILNMVPTKKVDKTPYEIWHGKAPKLSYLKFSGRDNDLEDDHMDTLPSENTSEIPVESKSLDSPSELIPVHEDIYMEQPEGYVDPKYPNRVCKLQRSIYGLKQASRQWNKRFDEEIKKFRFIQNRDEPCVYRKASGSDVVFLILYVDDILIMGNNILRLNEVKDYLGKCFSMKDLGEATYILGIKIYRDRSRRLIGLSQMYGGKPDTELDITVDWKSKKQTTIAMHSVQAEYVAASEAAMEAVWISKFVGDLGVMPSINKPINMYCDNSAAIIFANEPGIMKGARHFLWRYHYVREQVETGEIKLIRVHTDDNLADPFTKAFPRGMVIDHVKGIGLQLASSFMHTCD